MLNYLKSCSRYSFADRWRCERSPDVTSSWAKAAFTLSFLGILWLTTIVTSIAQDNPFDLPNGLPGLDDPAGPRLSNDTNQEADDLDTALTSQLKLSARRSDVAAAESIAALARIGRWKDVDQMLTSASGRKISDAILVEMGNRIGPALMIRIRLHESLSDSSRQFIDRISGAAKSASESPQRLQAAIKQLGSDSRDTQLAGLRIVRSGGYSAITELVHAAIAKDRVAARDDLLRALASFGPSGVEALRQVALYGDHKTVSEIRMHAIDSLVRLTGRGAAIELITALNATDSSDTERNAAAQHLVELGLVGSSGSMPGRNVALQFLQQDLQRARAAALRTHFDEQMTTMWSVNENGDGVVYQEAPSYLKAYRAATDAANRIRRIGIDSAEIAQDVLSSDIGYRVLVDPDWGDADQALAMRAAYPQQLTAEALSQAINNAIDRHDNVALIGMLRLVSAVFDASQAGPLFDTISAVSSPLVRAASHPQPRVRFEAAVAITKIAPPGGYSGSSYVLRTLGEMSSLGELPTALLLETRPDIIIAQENLLNQMGYDVVVVGSTGEMEKCVAAGGDLRLLLAKTEIFDTTAIELIDRIRRLPRGRDFPILLYGHFAPGLDADRWDAPTLLIDQPASTAGFAEVLRSVQWHQSLPALSATERQRFRQIAKDALDGLATRR